MAGNSSNVALAPMVAQVPSTDLYQSLNDMERVAKACAASGYYKDARDLSQALVKMLAGREMGVGPIQALAQIHIVEGKPAAGASLIAANVKRSGRYDYRVKVRTNEECVLEWFEQGKSVGESSFTLDDARRAGLAGKNNWKSYPRAMLFARALTEGVRVYCPDAAGGVIYTPEELGAASTNENGEPLEREERDVTPPKPAAPSRAVKHGKRAEPAEVDEPGEFISEAQRRRLFAAAQERCKALGIDEPDGHHTMLRLLLAEGGIESTKQIPADHFDGVLAAIESYELPTAGDAA